RLPCESGVGRDLRRRGENPRDDCGLHRLRLAATRRASQSSGTQTQPRAPMQTTPAAASQTLHPDADFAAEVLAELYTYPPKRPWVARLLWALTGWFGGHRFYLYRPGP